MEDTCRGEECPIYKKLKLKDVGQCPNFIESWFTPIDIKGVEGAPVLVKDCVNKRLLIMIQELTNNLNGLHKSQDKLKNQVIAVNETTAYVMNKIAKQKLLEV